MKEFERDFNNEEFDVPKLTISQRLCFLNNDLNDENSSAYKWFRRSSLIGAVSLAAMIGVVEFKNRNYQPTYKERVELQYYKFVKCMPGNMSVPWVESLKIKAVYPQYELDKDIEADLERCRAKYPLPSHSVQSK